MGIGAAIGSAVIGAASSNKAAKSQERAARNQTELAERQYDQTVERFEPFYDSGLNYQNALNFELLGGQRPTITPSGLSIEQGERITRTVDPTYAPGGRGEGTVISPGRDITETYYSVGDQEFDTRGAAQGYLDSQGTPYQGFQATPGYQFMVDEGMRALEGSAAAAGNLYSGGTLKSISDYGQGMANQEYNNYLNRLAGQAGQGQAAAGNLANASNNYTMTASNALANAGNAQAAGAIGVGNSINGGINNALGAFQYAGGGGGINDFNRDGNWLNGLFG